MRIKMQPVAVILLLGAGLSWAQGPRGGVNGGRGNRLGTRLDLSRIQTVEGTVTATDMAYGAQYPSVAIGDTHVKVAPAWYLLESDFEIRIGDRVRIAAAPSAVPGDAYLHALEIVKTATGKSIALRDASGFPLWSGRLGGNRTAVGSQGAQGACIDPASITSVSGVVEKVTYGAGIEMPLLVLKTGDGSLVSMKIGPERILLESDFEIQPGDALTARTARLTCWDEVVALSLTNAAGGTVVLRTDDGTPAWTF